MNGFRTRKVRWEQFLLLFSGIVSGMVAGICWFCMGDDHDCNANWKKQVVGVVVVLILAVFLVGVARWYVWR